MFGRTRLELHEARQVLEYARAIAELTEHTRELAMEGDALRIGLASFEQHFERRDGALAGRLLAVSLLQEERGAMKLGLVEPGARRFLGRRRPARRRP